jgi:translocation and assembly module TamB
MKGNNKSGIIEGFLSSEELNIYLPDRFTKDIPSLNITEVISNSKKLEKEDSKPFNYPIFLDIILQAKNKVFIHGWGVDAELHGKLTLKDNIDKPQVKGKLSTIRGSYEEFGKKFKLKTAELLFEGNIPPSPYLNITGSITKAGIEIMPVLSGPMLNPSLSIESSPTKPQEEILSILLFGKDSSKINTLQAVQLASNLKKISTNKDSGFDPFRKIRDTFGLDEISINGNQDTTNNPSLGVAKYISDNVRIKADQGKESKSGKVGVEVDLSPNVSVESGGSISGESNNIGLNWKHDY